MSVEINETSLARLSDHEWQILSNTWARGVDWYVQKVGRKWTPIDIFGAFPLFKTKREAEAAASTLLLWESSNRSLKRIQAQAQDKGEQCIYCGKDSKTCEHFKDECLICREDVSDCRCERIL